MARDDFDRKYGRPFTIRITDDMRAELRTIAETQDRTMAYVARKMIVAALNRERNLIRDDKN